MKKILLVLLFLGVVVGVSHAQTTNWNDITSEVDEIFTSISSNMASSLNNSMQTYVGAGNISPMDTSPYFGLKLGIGVGISMSGKLLQMATGEISPDEFAGVEQDSTDTNEANIADMIGPVFTVLEANLFPYDFVYAKLGLPEGLIDIIPLLKDTDIGIRVGVLPNVGPLLIGGDGTFSAPLEGGGEYTVGVFTKGFHFGVELRTLLLGKPKSILNADLRASLDMDFGSIGIVGDVTMPWDMSGIQVDLIGETGIGFKWRGVALGFKAMGGINLRLLQIYGGLGLTFNIGSVIGDTYLNLDTEAMGVDVSLAELGEPYAAWFDFAEITVIGGVKLLGFLNVGVEYALIRGNVAVSVVPLALAF